MKGRIIEINNDTAIVFTKSGTFIKTKNFGNAGIGDEITLRSPVRVYSKAIASAAAAVLIFAGGITSYCTPVSYVDICINPEIELGINMFDIVVSAEPKNNDGKAVLELENVSNTRVDNAIDSILSNAEELGFIPESEEKTVVLSVFSSKETRAREMYENINSYEMPEKINKVVKLANDEDIENAAGENIPVGKYLLINELSEIADDMPKEKIRDYSVKEIINNIDKAKSKNSKTSPVATPVSTQKPENTDMTSSDSTAENDTPAKDYRKDKSNGKSKNNRSSGNDHTENHKPDDMPSYSPAQTTKPVFSNVADTIRSNADSAPSATPAADTPDYKNQDKQNQAGNRENVKADREKNNPHSDKQNNNRNEASTGFIPPFGGHGDFTAPTAPENTENKPEAPIADTPQADNPKEEHSELPPYNPSVNYQSENPPAKPDEGMHSDKPEYSPFDENHSGREEQTNPFTDDSDDVDLEYPYADNSGRNDNSGTAENNSGSHSPSDEIQNDSNADYNAPDSSFGGRDNDNSNTPDNGFGGRDNDDSDAPDSDFGGRENGDSDAPDSDFGGRGNDDHGSFEPAEPDEPNGGFGNRSPFDR